VHRVRCAGRSVGGLAVADLLIIVPSRGRPQSVARVVEAWRATGALGVADLLVAVDADDPEIEGYRRAVPAAAGTAPVSRYEVPAWMPMVHKLDLAACDASESYWALGYAGDDHVPRTPGWADRYLAELARLGVGIVYGDDRIQGQRLPTQWAMTADIVRELGRMVPAPVEHLYCDNAVADLGRAAGCLVYLPDVVIEHRHPLVGAAPWDEQYRRVNSSEQYARDRAAYERWRAEQMGADVDAVRQLRQTPDTPPVLSGEVVAGA